jgi:hypothetical protein
MMEAEAAVVICDWCGSRLTVISWTEEPLFPGLGEPVDIETTLCGCGVKSVEKAR